MSIYINDRQILTTFDFLSLRRRWKIVVACIVFSVTLGMLFVALKPANYTASTQLLIYIKEVQPGPDPVISLGRADLTQVENESEIVRSRGTLAKVVRSLNLTDDPEFAPATTPLHGIAQSLFGLFGEPRATSDESRGRQEIAVESLAKHLTVKRVGTSHTILINVTTSDPEKSARIANGISQILVQGRISAVQDGDRSPLLRERLRGLGPSAYVMTPALAPDKPNGPRKILIILAAIIAGSMIGSALALLLDFKDKTIRTAQQVERFGLECIGAIPLLKCRETTVSSRTQAGKGHAGNDEFLPDPLLNRTLLRVAVAIEAAEARIVGIASPIAGEGATTVARHLAHLAARSQRKVLLVELDRSETPRPVTGEVSFGPEAFSDTQPQPLGGNLRSSNGNGPDVLAPDVLATDALNNRDSAASWWMHCDRKSLAAYDLIVVSLPPLERGPEFRMVAQNIDGILLVMKWGGADMERVERAFAVSSAAPSDFIGAVLNMIDGRMIGRFGDKFWEAEAFMAVRRHLSVPAMPVAPVAR